MSRVSHVKVALAIAAERLQGKTASSHETRPAASAPPRPTRRGKMATSYVLVAASAARRNVGKGHRWHFDTSC